MLVGQLLAVSPGSIGIYVIDHLLQDTEKTFTMNSVGKTSSITLGGLGAFG